MTPDTGLPEQTLSEIQRCLHERFPQLHWVKLYGSRAMGRHWRGSDIDLAYSADENCSAALLAPLGIGSSPSWLSIRAARSGSSGVSSTATSRQVSSTA